MITFLRFAALLLLILSSFTLIKPRTGWGRLIFFVPKLFAGSWISWIGLLGLCSSILGWFFLKDGWATSFGLGSVAVSIRHISRIVRRSWQIGQSLNLPNPPQKDKSQQAMLSYPWVVRWRGSPSEVLWQQDVPIAHHTETGEALLADLWQSANANGRSGLGLIYLHGSGWHYADKDFGTRHFFRHLARQGHVIADLAYTLAPKADLFRMIADIKIAIDWMKQQNQLGVRADRIILMGGSAGGHLALLAGYTPNHPKLDPAGVVNDTSVHGVVSYYGPPNLKAQFDRFAELPGLTGSTRIERIFMNSLEARFGFETLPVHCLLPGFLGGTPAEVPELYDLGSPSNHVSKHCPPTLLLQGLHDFSGAAPEVRKLYNALRKIGCPAFLLELPDTDHGFDLYKPKWSPAAQAATYVTERFLASLV